MIPAIKAEFTKIFSVRSTYFILAICLLIEILFAFYATSYKASASDLMDPGFLTSEVTGAVMFLSTILSLVAILLVTHEYRYNTIVYTLSAARNRSLVFLAKIVAISSFMIIFILIFAVLSPILAELGVHASGRHLISQHLSISSLLWRVVFSGWAYSMLAFILALIVRVQVGAIAAIFLLPGTVEALIGLLLKKNQVYLPFTAISAVISRDQLSYGRAAAVAMVYVVLGWLLAWALFQRRDAN
jgi:ABC-2 type transport system permease protein